MAFALPLVGAALAVGGTAAAYNEYKQRRGYSDAYKARANAPQPPTPPNQDTAANAALSQTDELRRRRGVYANIIGNQTTAGTPVATKSLLGT